MSAIYGVIVLGKEKVHYPNPIAYFSTETKAKDFIELCKNQFYQKSDGSLHDYRFLELGYETLPLDIFDNGALKIEMMHFDSIGDKSVFETAEFLSNQKNNHETKAIHPRIRSTIEKVLVERKDLDYHRKNIILKGNKHMPFTLDNVQMLKKYLQKLIDLTEPMRLEGRPQHIEDVVLLLDSVNSLLEEDKEEGYQNLLSSVLDIDTNVLSYLNRHMYLEFEPVTVGYFKSMERTLSALYVLSCLKNQAFQSFVVWDNVDDTYTFFYSEKQVNQFIKSKLNGSIGLEKITEVSNRYHVMHYSDSDMAEVSGISLETLKTLGYDFHDFTVILSDDGSVPPVRFKMYSGSYTPDIKFDVHVGLALEKGRQ